MSPSRRDFVIGSTAALAATHMPTAAAADSNTAEKVLAENVKGEIADRLVAKGIDDLSKLN